MTAKLGAKKLPDGKGAQDFTYRGRPAASQGDFGPDVGLAELEAVDQSGQPESKYYHGGVVQSSDGVWWVYLEWGSIKPGTSWTGSKCSQSFQFVQGDDEDDARKFFADQMASKNSRRLVQKTIGGQSLWVSKGKDSGYAVVAPTHERGLPDAYARAASPAPAPAPVKTPDPVEVVELVPFSPALAPLLAQAVLRPSQETVTIGGLHATTHDSLILVALPPAPGPAPLRQNRLLLSPRHLTLPTQQLPLHDLQAVDATTDHLTFALESGETAAVETRLDEPEAAWLVDQIWLFRARRRASLALLRQLRGR